MIRRRKRKSHSHDASIPAYRKQARHGQHHYNHEKSWARFEKMVMLLAVMSIFTVVGMWMDMGENQSRPVQEVAKKAVSEPIKEVNRGIASVQK